MKRDTRINLVFLAVFLAISLPGAVILFRKKLDPRASRMDQPDAVVTTLPYMAPPSARPGVRRLVPPQTQAWLEQLNRERHGGRELLSGREGAWSPVISDDCAMQVVDLDARPPGARVSIVLWDAASGAGARPTLTASMPDGRSVTGQIQSAQIIALPKDIKSELMSMHEVQPPQNILWVRVTFPSWPREGSATIEGDFAGRDGMHHSAVAIH